MRRWALFALLAIPLADILLLIYLAGVIGAVATVALVVVTGLVGLLLVRAEGRQTLRRMQQKVATGESPADQLLDGGLLIAAGAFLLTPGLITDVIGLAFVLPPTRYLVRTGLKRYVVVPELDERTGGFATGKVYTFGFPGQADGGTDRDPGPSGTDDPYDLGSDAYDIDLDGDDDDGTGKGNA